MGGLTEAISSAPSVGQRALVTHACRNKRKGKTILSRDESTAGDGACIYGIA